MAATALVPDQLHPYKEKTKIYAKRAQATSIKQPEGDRGTPGIENKPLRADDQCSKSSGQLVLFLKKKVIKIVTWWKLIYKYAITLETHLVFLYAIFLFNDNIKIIFLTIP